MNPLLETEVARLDGYIHGITELSGHIREYLGAAYLIPRKDQQKSVADLLITHFAHQTQLDFISVTKLPRGMGSLEEELYEHLVIDVLGSVGSSSDETVLDRKKYLSFRIMDMFRVILDQLGPCVGVYKLISKYNKFNLVCTSQSVYFAALFDRALVVLQFIKVSYDD